MHWENDRDMISISFSAKTGETKRGILIFLASVFDSLGIISPLILYGKILFRETCDLKIG